MCRRLKLLGAVLLTGCSVLLATAQGPCRQSTSIHPSGGHAITIDYVHVRTVEFLSGTQEFVVPVNLKQRISKSVLTDDTEVREFDRTTLENDVEELALHVLQEAGYYKAEPRVANVVPVGGGKDTIDLVLDLQEIGPIYKVRQIQFSKNRAFSSGDLRKLFDTQDGEVFNRTVIGAGLEAMRSLYGTKGYINFTSVPDVVDHSDDSITIKIDVDEGRAYHVSSTRLLGIDEERARSLIAGSALQPGTVYNPGAVESFAESHKDLFQGRLYSRLSEAFDHRLGLVALTFDLRNCPE